MLGASGLLVVPGLLAIGKGKGKGKGKG